jgi:hypothetical protein
LETSDGGARKENIIGVGEDVVAMIPNAHAAVHVIKLLNKRHIKDIEKKRGTETSLTSSSLDTDEKTLALVPAYSDRHVCIPFVEDPPAVIRESFCCLEEESTMRNGVKSTLRIETAKVHTAALRDAVGGHIMGEGDCSSSASVLNKPELAWMNREMSTFLKYVEFQQFGENYRYCD